MTVQRPHPSAVIACRDALEKLVSQTQGITGASVVTGDGFDIASRLRRASTAEQLAAMTSSMLSLGEAIVQDLAQGRCRNVMVEAEHGWLLMMRLPSNLHDWLLCVQCDAQATLGAVLFVARTTARQLAERLDEVPPR